MIITKIGNLILNNRAGDIENSLSKDLLEQVVPRYVFFPFWSWRIPTEIHMAYECVIFHMTDVPYGRGGQPYENLMQRGHSDTMLSALRCVDDWDAGPVYMKVAMDLCNNKEATCNTASMLIHKVMIPFIEEYMPEPVEQRGEVVKFKRIT